MYIIIKTPNFSNQLLTGEMLKKHVEWECVLEIVSDAISDKTWI